MPPSNPVIGLLLIGLALAIVWKQARARSCSRHSRLAGWLALLLAAGCALAGAVLVAAGA
jgi:hypothetical protein